MLLVPIGTSFQNIIGWHFSTDRRNYLYHSYHEVIIQFKIITKVGFCLTRMNPQNLNELTGPISLASQHERKVPRLGSFLLNSFTNYRFGGLKRVHAII